jgi:hypothetical protein
VSPKCRTLTSDRTSTSKLSSSMKIFSHPRYGVTVSTYGKLDVHEPLAIAVRRYVVDDPHHAPALELNLIPSPTRPCPAPAARGKGRNRAS